MTSEGARKIFIRLAGIMHRVCRNDLSFAATRIYH